MITHVGFIALNVAAPLGRCLSTQPSGLLFQQLPWDPANVNTCKNMYDLDMLQVTTCLFCFCTFQHSFENASLALGGTLNLVESVLKQEVK